jgi:hypothetical protein
MGQNAVTQQLPIQARQPAEQLRKPLENVVQERSKLERIERPQERLDELLEPSRD